MADRRFYAIVDEMEMIATFLEPDEKGRLPTSTIPRGPREADLAAMSEEVCDAPVFTSGWGRDDLLGKAGTR